MNKFWITYFLFMIVYEIILISVLLQKGYFEYTISDLFVVIFIVGLYGLAFQRKIISDKFWKVIFAFSTLLFLHTWIVMPIIYKLSARLPISKIIITQLFSVPSIPLFVALYVYAWRSERIWKGGT